MKIYSLATYKVTHGLKFHSPVLSLALSPENMVLAAGTADSSLIIRRKEPKPEVDPYAEFRRKNPRHGTEAYLKRGAAAPVGEDQVEVKTTKTKALKPYDKSLKKFRYQDALTQALDTRDPNVVVTVLEELKRRQGLEIALRGRDEKSLEPILSFLARWVAYPRHSVTLIDVVHVVLDLYGGALGQSDRIDDVMAKLAKQTRAEAEFQQQALGLMGSVNVLVGAASASAQGIAGHQ